MYPSMYLKKIHYFLAHFESCQCQIEENLTLVASLVVYYFKQMWCSSQYTPCFTIHGQLKLHIYNIQHVQNMCCVSLTYSVTWTTHSS